MDKLIESAIKGCSIDDFGELLQLTCMYLGRETEIHIDVDNVVNRGDPLKGVIAEGALNPAELVGKRVMLNSNQSPFMLEFIEASDV